LAGSRANLVPMLYACAAMNARRWRRMRFAPETPFSIVRSSSSTAVQRPPALQRASNWLSTSYNFHENEELTLCRPERPIPIIFSLIRINFG
jgi:hypothetical protein